MYWDNAVAAKFPQMCLAALSSLVGAVDLQGGKPQMAQMKTDNALDAKSSQMCLVALHSLAGAMDLQGKTADGTDEEG